MCIGLEFSCFKMLYNQSNTAIKRDFVNYFLPFMSIAYLGQSIWCFYEILRYMYNDYIITEIYVFCAFSAFLNLLNSLGTFVIFIYPSSRYKPECFLNTVLNLTMFIWNNVLLFNVIGTSNMFNNSLNTIVFSQYIFNCIFMLILFMNLLKLGIRYVDILSNKNTSNSYEMLLSGNL